MNEPKVEVYQSSGEWLWRRVVDGQVVETSLAFLDREQAINDATTHNPDASRDGRIEVVGSLHVEIVDNAVEHDA